MRSNQICLFIKARMIIFLATVMTLLSYGKCNIWDNFLSQLKSPHYRIPDEFTLMLVKEGVNVMNISSTYAYNSYKISLFQNPFPSINNQVKNNFFLQTAVNNIKSTGLAYLESFKNISTNTNTNDNIFYNYFQSSNSTANTTIMDIYVNFTQGMVYLDYPESCRFINVTALQKFSSKFFLESYEFITLFEADDLYFNYILMNPLRSKITKQIAEKTQSKFLQNNDNDKTGIISSVGNFSPATSLVKQLVGLLSKLGIFPFSSTSKYDEDYQIYFKIDRKEQKMKLISVIYKGLNLLNLDVNYLARNFTADFFEPENTNCTELVPSNITNITLY